MADDHDRRRNTVGPAGGRKNGLDACVRRNLADNAVLVRQRFGRLHGARGGAGVSGAGGFGLNPMGQNGQDRGILPNTTFV